MHDTHVVVVRPSRAIEEDETLYVRLDVMDGMVFNGIEVEASHTLRRTEVADGVTTETTTFAAGARIPSENLIAGGAAGQSHVVFRSPAIPLNSYVMFDVEHALAVPLGTGAYRASISAYGNPDDAVDGRGAVGSIAGEATIVRVVSGLDASVTAGDPVEASVATGFRWFNPGPRAQARLGLFQAIAAPMGMVLSADDGLMAEDMDIINPADDSVTVSVEGDLTIGAFSVVRYNAAMPADDQAEPAVVAMDAGYDACPVGPAEVDDDPMNDDMGSLTNPDDAEAAVTSVGVESLGAGMYGLCVNVDTGGPMSNMNAVPEGEYTATVSVLSPGAMDPVEAASGTIGTITRDGASVEIAYLTTSEKHNQRIIIVNRGSSPVPITGIDFTSEDGVEVELLAPVQAALDNGLLAVPGNSSWVARMDETIAITSSGTPKRRTAATINFFGISDNLSVATTQVNLSDGSTDTVVYMVE